jgi:large subunit ribosomal protein L24
MKIKKNDKVMIMKGKDRGKTGKVSAVFTKENRVMVDGLNLYKKAIRPRRAEEKGQIISVPKPVAAANVQVVCPSCGKPTRIGYEAEGQSKNRICKKCKKTL